MHLNGKLRKTAFTCVLFLIFLIFYFPGTKIKNSVVTNLNRSAPMRASVGNLGLSLFPVPGLYLENTPMYIGSNELLLNEIKVHPSIPKFSPGFFVMLGTNIETRSADISGKFGSDLKMKTAALSDMSLNIKDLLSFLNDLGAPAKARGQIEGEIDNFVMKSFSSARTWHHALSLTEEASADFNLKNLVLPSQNLKLGYFNTKLPTTKIGKGKVKFTINKGKLLIKEMKIGDSASDIEATLTGDAKFSPSLRGSSVNLKANIRINPDFMEKLPGSFKFLIPESIQKKGVAKLEITGNLPLPQFKTL